VFTSWIQAQAVGALRGDRSLYSQTAGFFYDLAIECEMSSVHRGGGVVPRDITAASPETLHSCLGHADGFVNLGNVVGLATS